MKNFITINGLPVEVKSVKSVKVLDNYGDNPWWNHWEVIVISVNEVGYHGTMDGDDRANSWAFDTFELYED